MEGQPSPGTENEISKKIIIKGRTLSPGGCAKSLFSKEEIDALSAPVKPGEILEEVEEAHATIPKMGSPAFRAIS